MTTSSPKPSPEIPQPTGNPEIVLTCDAARLYPWGGFSGDRQLFEGLRHRASPRTDILDEVFPPWRIRRPPPAFLDGGDAASRTALSDRFAALDATYPAGPATLLCESRDIHFAGGVLYVVEDDVPLVLHETFRPHERAMIAGPGPDFARVDETIDDAGPFLLLDSVGSFNYGHFLIDDLSRLAALAHLPKAGRQVTILMIAYNVLIDAVRRRAIATMLEGRRPVTIRFLDRGRHYRFARLLHVTPASEQPVLKSPEAVNLLAARMRAHTRGLRIRSLLHRVARGRWRGPRLFVDRNPVRGRELVNRPAVLAMMRSRGFEVFDPESTGIRQQAARFTEAGLVVGIAGAAMTNTVFCVPGTPLLYLSPDGWDDPFFWDLAATRGHPYAALSGPRLPSPGPDHLRPFEIDLDALAASLTRIGAGP